MATKIKNIPFVGGDTAEFEFDFGTKVYDSMAECPMNVYYSIMSSVQAPTNITSDSATGFRKWTSGYRSQTDFDKLKTQDGAYINPQATPSGGIMQVMIELDLTALCNSLFGGSTSAMATALKSIILNAWTKGSGATGNALTGEIWGAYSSVWALAATNYTNSLSNLNITDSIDGGNNAGHAITSANKVYFHFYAPASDGTIPSEVDIDYINIKLQFARVPDVIAPIPITLPDMWSMVIKGFSPAWDGSLTSDKVILTLSPNYNDFNNFIMVQKYTSTANTYRVVMLVAGTKVADLLITQTITKFKTVNFLLTKNNNILTFYLLINGSVVNKQSTTISSTLSGVLNMYIGQRQDNGAQADGFINSIIFLPNKYFDDDTEAEAVLRGTAEGFENDELFDISKVSTSSSVSKTSNSIIVNGTSAYQGVWNLYIPVLPNNKYHIHCEYSDTSVGMIRIDEHYNDINLGTNPASGIPTDGDITVGSKTNNLKFVLTNKVVGTVTFSNISLKLKM